MFLTFSELNQYQKSETSARGAVRDMVTSRDGQLWATQDAINEQSCQERLGALAYLALT